MRVLHVINGLGTGGAERSLAELLPWYDAAGIESAVVCLARKPDGVHAEVEAAGCPVTVVGPDRGAAAWRLRRAIARMRPDIVHTTIFDADVLGRVAAVGFPCKVVSSLVNTFGSVRLADPTVSQRKLAAARLVNTVTARHLTDHFHAISGAVRESAVLHLGIDPARVTVVERGRDLARLGETSPDRRRSVRRSLGLREDAEVVLNVGRQEPQKGHVHLLDAIAKLAVTRPRLVLVQAGREGKATANLRRIAEGYGIEERTVFLGHRGDIGGLLAAADVFAFPSIYEGLGGSVLEAMAMRVPVVVSDVPALVDVVECGRGATVVPVGDAAGLATAIDEVFAFPGRAASRVDEAHRIFQRRFTLERSASGMVDLYHKVAAGE